MTNVSCHENMFLAYANKGTDQLHNNRAADQRLSFGYIDSTIPQHPNVKPLAIFGCCTSRFSSVEPGRPETPKLRFLMTWLQ